MGEEFSKNNIKAKKEIQNQYGSYDSEIKDKINFEKYNTQNILRNINNINNLSNIFDLYWHKRIKV